MRLAAFSPVPRPLLLAQPAAAAALSVCTEASPEGSTWSSQLADHHQRLGRCADESPGRVRRRQGDGGAIAGRALVGVRRRPELSLRPAPGCALPQHRLLQAELQRRTPTTWCSALAHASIRPIPGTRWRRTASARQSMQLPELDQAGGEKAATTRCCSFSTTPTRPSCRC